MLASLIGPGRKNLCNGEYLIADRHDPATKVEAESSRNLVVATSAGVDLGSDIPRELGYTPLDRGVDVLVGCFEDEAVLGKLDPNLIERAEEHGHFIKRKDPCPAEAVDVRDRPS